MTTLPLFALFALGHLFTAYGEVGEVGRIHYYTHALYARLEPLVVKTVDAIVSNPFFSKNPVGKAILWFFASTNVLLPHGVVIPTSAAIRIVRDIEKHGKDGHIAVGTCVCQHILQRKSEPSVKDMTIWYGAEIYTRFRKDDYRMISADEAVNLLREFHRVGLTPVAEFLMQSRKWFFVLCNCDDKICAPKRVYNAVGRSLYPGPFIVVQDSSKCLGREKCGKCVTRCPFNANLIDGGKVTLDSLKCMGCGLCVTTCEGKARQLKRREGYSGRLLPWEYVKDAEKDEI